MLNDPVALKRYFLLRRYRRVVKLLDKEWQRLEAKKKDGVDSEEYRLSLLRALKLVRDLVSITEALRIT